MSLDPINSLALGIGGGLAVAYAVRVVIKGRAHFDRVEQQGSGLFLRRTLMEMGYWGMQPLAQGLVRAGISASAVTWASFLLGGGAGVAFAFGRLELGGLLGAFSGILDAVDGMVARLSGTATTRGKILDSTLDRYVEFFLFAGLLLHYRQNFALELLALIALAGSFMVSYSTALGEIFEIELRGGSMRRPERMLCLVLGALLSAQPVAMPIALGLIAVVANLSAIRRFREIRKVL
ncbi:MAG: CDP-alcohol phosphatidyltransferase family protein [Oligoflexia bacterium]|nr:CDP-alcohol phosphatidyltransferase family protein [Oligoflexia bacterium]